MASFTFHGGASETTELNQPSDSLRDTYSEALDCMHIQPLKFPEDSNANTPVTPDTPRARLEGRLGEKLTQIRNDHVQWPSLDEAVPIPLDREHLLTGELPPVSTEIQLQLQTFNSPQACLAAAVMSFEEIQPGSADSQPALNFLRVMTQRAYERDVVSKLLTYDLEFAVEKTMWQSYLSDLDQVKTRMTIELDQRRVVCEKQKQHMDEFLTELKQAKEETRGTLEDALAFASEAQERLLTLQSDLDSESREFKSSSLVGPEVVKRDISSVSRVVLKRIVMFLKPKEYVTCFRVCKRWRQTLDVGYLWKTIFAQSVRYLKRKLMRQEETRRAQLDLETAIPKSASIPVLGLNLKKAKSGISKSEIYEMCLSQVRGQAELAKSEHEDLTHQVTTRQQVYDFLEKSIAKARGMYGEALAGRATAEAKLAQLRKRKTEVAQAVSELEEEIKQEAEMQEQAQSRLAMSLADVEHRLRVLTEGNMTSTLAQTRERAESLGLNITGGGNHGTGSTEEGSEVSLSGEQLVEKLTENKRKLLKNVKALMFEIDQGNQLADALSEALRKLGANPPPAPDFKKDR